MNIRYDRIKAIADSKQLSMTKILTDLHQSKNNFTNWKNGISNPSYSNLQAIANYLNVDVRYFLDLTDSPTGYDSIKKGIEKLSEIGIEVESFDGDNGIGQEYALIYRNKTYIYQEHEFKSLCLKLLQFLNDAEIQAIENFCSMVIEK